MKEAEFDALDYVAKLKALNTEGKMIQTFSSEGKQVTTFQLGLFYVELRRDCDSTHYDQFEIQQTFDPRKYSIF